MGFNGPFFEGNKMEQNSPKPWKMKVLTPKNMGEITPKNEGNLFEGNKIPSFSSGGNDETEPPPVQVSSRQGTWPGGWFFSGLF